ncbi:MAG: DUF5916 domain-containing protein, partial [Flavobacteriaceae bacterium]
MRKKSNLIGQFVLTFLCHYSNLFAQEDDLKIIIPSIEENIKIDGIGNESVWDQTDWASNFWQWRPTDTLKAQKQTQFKMLRDNQNLYILIISQVDGTQFTTPNLKRDFSTFGTDYITLLFDTFNDGTNAFSFATNPIGLKSDGLISGGNQSYRTDRNYAWDTKWLVETQIQEDQYTAEIKIPFSSFFYDHANPYWRFNIYRNNTQGNEFSIWARTPQNQTIGNLGFMGKMVFETPLKKRRNPISLIPYLSGALQKDYVNPSQSSAYQVGGDAKIPIGNSLNLDLTLNPDFSQVEVDDQVVNLTRFEISLPEKRQFFTQNSDLFSDFGNVRDALPF